VPGLRGSFLRGAVPHGSPLIHMSPHGITAIVSLPGRGAGLGRSTLDGRLRVRASRFGLASRVGAAVRSGVSCWRCCTETGSSTGARNEERADLVRKVLRKLNTRPKNHVCVGATNGSFCSRVQVDCMEDFDCVDLSPRCEDIDVDGKKECAGVFDPNQVPSVACVNSMCTDTSAPVCEAAGAGSATQCGQYGLCLDDADCPAGFNCVGLWPDGRKECVPGGGSCSSFADCPVRQVCASPREGGVPSCQAGFQP
jgi:hypothetical protein